MAVTWNINSMNRDIKQGSNDNIVTTLHWIASDADADGNTGSSYGSIGVTLVGTPKAYKDITEADAIGWAKDALGSDEVAEIEANIAGMIAKAKTPTTASGVSW